MKIITTGKTPIYAWVDGVEFDDTARKQLEAIASLPIVYHHVAAMPDVHAGSVIPTLAAIVPAAFEKDVGKVMKAQADLVAIVHAMRQVICIKG
jgi:tRNA-splicing ligase RtcB